MRNKVIALGCEMLGDRPGMRARKLTRIGLDTDPAARRPQDHQIVLLNHEPRLCAAAAAVED